MLLIFFLVYLWVAGHWAGIILGRVFDLTTTFSKQILGAFAVFATLGSIAGVAILFLPLTFWVLVGIFSLNALVFFLVARRANKIEKVSFAVDFETDVQWMSATRFASVAFLILVGYGFYLLYNSRTGNALLTPWQTINPQYIFIFFFSTLTLGVLIWSKLKTSILIFFLILQTFLLHSYLPLTHSLIYGADGWRHIANEQRLLDGKNFLEAIIVDTDTLNSLQTAVGQLSYGNFWASNVIVAKVFSLDLLTVTKWFLPILWSLVFPLLLFEVGCAFGWNKKQSLFLSWLGLLPFAWQVGGSFTLPASFGFLVWLFLILLILKRINSPNKGQVWILAGAGISLISGYILYFILFWTVWLVAEICLWHSKRNGFGKSAKLLRWVWLISSIVTVLSVAEWASSDTVYVPGNRFAQIRQAIGNFLGIYLANGPRPHDIPFGNIIFNQVPFLAFVPNLLTEWRWWIVVLMIFFFALACLGGWYLFKSNIIHDDWLAIISAGIFGSYIINNYFFASSHILTRRLDAVVALFFILLFFYGLEKFIFNNYKKIILTVIILSAAITASYSLGPDTNTVSANEYEAVKYIWSQERLESRRCVLGDTYPLLALEAISAKEIIGGDFWIRSDFSQPERVDLFNKANLAITDSVLQQIAQVTFADHCWFIGNKKSFEQQGVVNDLKVFGDTAAVRYNINY